MTTRRKFLSTGALAGGPRRRGSLPRLPILRGLCAVPAERPPFRSFPMAERKGSVSGLTDEEAQEFHRFWSQGFAGFTAVAVAAHLLVWIWRPWL